MGDSLRIRIGGGTSEGFECRVVWLVWETTNGSLAEFVGSEGGFKGVLGERPGCGHV